MPMLEEVGTYLAAAPRSRGVVGTTLFYGLMPDSPDTLITLHNMPGRPPEETFAVLPSDEHLTLQILTRAPTYAAAETLARDIWLDMLAHPTFTHVQAQQSPFLLERDESRRVVFACSYSVMRRL